MKEFFKEHKAGLITVALLFVTLFLALGVAPSEAITGAGGWLIVRGLTLVFAAFLGMMTYSKWKKPILNKACFKWTALWIVFTQIMATFYVAENCIGGF